jgi:hypothetical protein
VTIVFVVVVVVVVVSSVFDDLVLQDSMSSHLHLKSV